MITINCTSLKETLDIITSIIAIISIPIAIITYIITKRRERLDREYGTYDALDQRFIDYLQICLAHPELDIFSSPLPKQTPDWEQRRKEVIVYTILTSIFERSHLIYADGSTAVKKKQWEGWEKYIRDWAKRDKFRDAWQEIGIEQFDTQFVNYMNKIVKEAESQKTQTTNSG